MGGGGGWQEVDLEESMLDGTVILQPLCSLKNGLKRANGRTTLGS